VYNHVSYNNDGIDIDGCHDVTVSDCVIDSDDDALCLKSTLGRACENVTVSNCVLSSHANAFKLGTESNGGFKNITLSNCVILSPRFSKVKYGIQRGLGGIALETVDGGLLENIAVSNVIATRVGQVGCSITGLPGHPVEGVSLTNVSVEFEGGGKREWAEREVPELAEAYPESKMFGNLPAYGFYCRHVRGLTIRDLQLRTIEPDARHAIVCDDVHGLDLHGLRTQSTPDAAAVVRLAQCREALVQGCRPGGAVEVFLQVEGKASRGVALLNNDFSGVRRMFQITSEGSTDVVRKAGNLSPAAPARD
jgi:polygalacturonase